MTYRDPNQVAPVPAIERAYSDWSEIPNDQDQQSEASTEQTLDNLEYATSELTRATMEAQILDTGFALACENAELDGELPPTQLTEAEKKRLKTAVSSAREALKTLEALETQHEEPEPVSG